MLIKQNKQLKKYLTLLNQIINKADILLEVLDARMALDTRIPKIENKIRFKNKKLIFVLNKADLVPEKYILKIKEYLEKRYKTPSVFISTKTRKGSRALRRALKENAPLKKEGEKIIIGVFGYPNTGKSSLINLMVGRRKAPIAPIPGYTKGLQLIKMSKKFYWIDTPGVYLPQDEIELAIKGGIDPAQVKYPLKAAYELFNRVYKEPLKEKYNIDFNNFDEFIKELAKKYNYKKGSNWDLEKAARKFLYDWVKGKLNSYFIYDFI